MKYQSQFFLLCRLMKESGLAKIFVYQNKEYFKDRVEAYIVVNSSPPEARICIKDQTELSYLLATCNLLHEYGHCMDKFRYGETKRFKMADMWDVDTDYHMLKSEKRNLKIAVVKAEYMAWQFAKKLTRVWGLEFDQDWPAIAQTAHHIGIINRMNTKRYIDSPKYLDLYNFLSSSGVRVSIKDVNNLRPLLTQEEIERYLESE